MRGGDELEELLASFFRVLETIFVVFNFLFSQFQVFNERKKGNEISLRLWKISSVLEVSRFQFDDKLHASTAA